MVKIKHSKLKNTGLIYQVLVRNISIDILQNKDNSPAINILKNNFKYGTQLNQQYLLYNILLTNKVKNMQQAQLLLNEVLQLHNRLDKKKLLQQKYNVVQQIKQYYILQNLFLTRILEYKILASIYKVFQSRLVIQSYDPVDIINSKQIVLQYLTNTLQVKQQNNQIIQNFIRQDRDTQILAYKLLIERFNNKYKNSLNQDQKLLLNKYMHSFSNVGILKQYLQINIPIVINTIQQINKNITDNVVKIKIDQVLHQLNTITQSKIIKDNHIIALLKTFSLIQQLKKQSI